MFKRYLSILLLIFLSSSVFSRITGTLPSADDVWCVGPSGAEVCVDASGNLIPTTNNDADLGTSLLKWKDLYITGTISGGTTGSFTEGITVNESGSDSDSRFEGDTDTELLFIDAGNDRVGISTNTPSVLLDVQGTFNVTGATTIDNAVTINDTGNDVDFRVESDNQVNMLVVDAGTDTVIIGGGTGIKEILTATDTLDFPSIATVTDEDLTITVTGAAVGDACHLGLPAAPTGNLAWNCFVSATDTVTVRVHNYTDGAVDPASATYRVVTFGY